MKSLHRLFEREAIKVTQIDDTEGAVCVSNLMLTPRKTFTGIE
jgi:hypothetical protein